MANALPPLVLPSNSIVGNISDADAQAAAITFDKLGELLQTSNLPYSAAGGTADAITATYASITTLYTGLTVSVGINTVNATTAPTFAPTLSGVLQTARTIKKYVANSRTALVAGDLQGIVLLSYDAANTVWIVLNPNQVNAATTATTANRTDSGLVAIASAASPDIFAAAGNTIEMSGTATITSFVNAPKAGMERTIICLSACGFTCSAGLSIEGIPIGTTITMASNAIVKVIALSATQFKMTYSVSGTFTATCSTGMTTTPSGTAYWLSENGWVDLHVPSLSGTSNSTQFLITGLPAQLTPSGTRGFTAINCMDATSFATIGSWSIGGGGGTLTLTKDGSSIGWTNSGTKTLNTTSFRYHI